MAGRPVGLPKSGGRQKGTLNKRVTFRVMRASAVLEAAGVNPVTEILKLIPLLEPKEQVRAWEYLHQYVDLKPKELEDHDDEEAEDKLANLTTEQLVALAKREQ